MINEYLEVQDYLAGRRINPSCLYRICWLLAKWYREQGLTSLETRDAIFKWAMDNELYIEFSVTGLVYGVYEKEEKLRDSSGVVIYTADRDEILRRFDTHNTKLIALAVLCYAKAYADNEKCFNLSLAALSEWTGVNRSTLISRYMPLLKSFEYIDTVQREARWNDKKMQKANVYKLLVPIVSRGEQLGVLQDNDIQKLYAVVFAK